MDQFLKMNFEDHLIAVARIESLEFQSYSPRFKQIEALTLKLTEEIASKPAAKRNATQKCNIILDPQMIAPFEKQMLDTTLDIQNGEDVLVYLGTSKSICSIVHISKIKNDKVTFPAYRKQNEQIIDVKKMIKLLKSDFVRLSHALEK